MRDRILLGAYPDTFENSSSSSSIKDLSNFLADEVDSQIGLHLLPFCINAGDGRFAANSWTDIEPGLGTWADVNDLANQRALIVDCIFNHYGLDHPRVQAFFVSPDEYAEWFYAWKTDLDMRAPPSPRGGSMLREHFLAGERWLVWQTFSEIEFDIRLDHMTVEQEIVDHLRFLKKFGLNAVRIDAPAYFGKDLDGPPRHSSQSIALAQKILGQAKSLGLDSILQLDCDATARSYVPASALDTTAVIDFSFSAHLVLALLGADPSKFASHLDQTWRFDQTIIRCPRTHDGILMKSEFFEAEDRRILSQLASTYGLPVRQIDGEPYELNSSLPFIFDRLDKEKRDDISMLAIAVSAFAPDTSYLYLPFLLGFIPEEIVAEGEDPRSLNRTPIPRKLYAGFANSDRASKLRSLLRFLLRLKGRSSNSALRENDLVEARGHLLRAGRADQDALLIANFSGVGEPLPYDVASPPTFANNASETTIGPYGFGIWLA